MIKPNESFLFQDGLMMILMNLTIEIGVFVNLRVVYIEPFIRYKKF